MEAGRWSSGRPVFKKVDGEEKFLFVKEGINSWSIRDSLSTTEYHITSGRATNAPSSPEAGPSDTYGTTRWRFKNPGGNLVEGDISLTCKLDDDNEDDSKDGGDVI